MMDNPSQSPFYVEQSLPAPDGAVETLKMSSNSNGVNVGDECIGSSTDKSDNTSFRVDQSLPNPDDIRTMEAFKKKVKDVSDYML